MISFVINEDACIILISPEGIELLLLQQHDPAKCFYNAHQNSL